MVRYLPILVLLFFFSLFLFIIPLSFASRKTLPRILPQKAQQQYVLLPTPTPTITQFPIPIPTSIPSSTPTITPGPTQQLSLSSKQLYLLSQINDYRASHNLPSIKPDKTTCAFAQTRAGEIAQEFSHDGFSDRADTKTLPYSSYHEVTENIAMNSDYKQVVSGWIKSSGHAENMRKDTPYVCIGVQDNYYAYEGWKP